MANIKVEKKKEDESEAAKADVTVEPAQPKVTITDMDEPKPVEEAPRNPPSKRLAAEQAAGRAALERKYSPEAKAAEHAKGASKK